MNDARREAGFTAIELVVVIAIVGIAAAMAVPSWRATQANSRLRDAAGAVADALAAGRARAIADANNYVVYFDTGVTGGTDVCGNDLVDIQGNDVPILILDDENGNCCIDPGEGFITRPATPGIFFGTDFAAVAVPDDADPSGGFSQGSSFHDPGNNRTEWVAFRGDGIPVGFDGGGACTLGAPGTGGGGIYLNNDRRDMAVVLTALGSVKVHRYESVGATWVD